MVLQMYSILDKKSCVYGRPFYAHNDGHAMRSVLDELSHNESKSVMGSYPSDFVLCKLGSYDDSSGVITPIDVTVVVEIVELVMKDSDHG